MNKTEFLNKMVGRGRISEADVAVITETKADNDELVTDLIDFISEYRAGSLSTLAKLQKAVDKIVAKQDKRDQRKAERDAKKSERIAARDKK